MKKILSGYILIVLFAPILNFGQNNSAVNYLEASYIITVIDSTTYPYKDEKIPEYTISNTIISGYLAVDIAKHRVERYVKDPKTRSECEPLDHCPVLKGTSRITEYADGDFTKPSFEKKYPIAVFSNKKSMGYRYDKEGNERFLCTYISNSRGLNTVDMFVIEIKSYVAPHGMLPPLVPSYVIWLEPTGGLYNPTGEGSGYIWDNFESALVPISDPFSIEISSVSEIPDHDIDKSQAHKPLLITDYKAFDSFMLNPGQKSFSIVTKGTYYRKDENSGGEFYRKIKITVELNKPYIELAPLDPLEPIELSPIPPYEPIELVPLEPINPDEFELAPLEPIKNN